MDIIKNPAIFKNPNNIVGSYSAGTLTTNTLANYTWNPTDFSSNNTCVGLACNSQSTTLIGGRRKNNIYSNIMLKNKTFKKRCRSRRTNSTLYKTNSSKTKCKKNCRRKHKHTNRIRGGCGCGTPSPIIAGGGASSLNSTKPMSFGYRLDSNRLGSESSALASPIPFKQYFACSK